MEQPFRHTKQRGPHLDGVVGAGADGRQQARCVAVFVVVPPRLLLLDLAGPLEVLRWANHVQSAVRFEVRYVGPCASLQTSIGLALARIEPLPASLPPATLVVLPGDVEQVMRWGEDSPGGSPAADAAAEDAIVAWLRKTIVPTHKLICICSGALIAARAGLLDGHACTTHHSCCAELARLAPRARVLENRLYVEDGACYSSAGITTGIDLMLHIVSRMTDQACAIAVARYLVVYLRRNGTDPQLSPWLEGRNHVHPAVHRVQDAIAADASKAWTLNRLARLAGVSTRHLSRLFNEHVGFGIAEYRNRLRVALAQEFLSQTRLSMERVAEQAGFGSARQMRRAWRRLHPGPPREARAGTEPERSTRRRPHGTAAALASRPGSVQAAAQPNPASVRG
jgi:transcriptional regulator GlxA family with amidase domain